VEECPCLIPPYFDYDTGLRYYDLDDVIKLLYSLYTFIALSFVYYTCDVNIYVENGSWLTYVMQSVLPQNRV
jgi:hypothetical protein